MSEMNEANNRQSEEYMMDDFLQQVQKMQMRGPGVVEESFKFYEKWIMHCMTLFGEESKIVAIAQDLMADLLASNGEWAPAFESYYDALRSTMFSFGDNHIRTALILEKIGNVCLQMQDLDGALNAFTNSMEKFRRILPLTDPQIIASFHNIARTHCLNGDDQSLRKALAVYQHSLVTQRSSLKRDLLTEATALSSVGQICSRLGFLDAAIGAHEEALSLKSRVLGDNHFDISTTLFAIANIHFNEKDYELALMTFKDCLDIRRSNSCNAEDISTDLFNIAAVSAENGNPTQAIDFFNQAISVETASTSESNDTILQCIHHIATLHQSQGKIDEAIKSALQASELALSDEKVSLSYKLELIRLSGNFYLEKGDVTKAHECFAKARELGCKSGLPASSKPVSARAA
jgi:tetratricopeptide (TPR) repeat protein